MRSFKRMNSTAWSVCVGFGLLAWLAVCTRAIVLYGTADPSANTTPPSGSLANSGWQYQGIWGAFSGTAIAPHYFISAKHIGGSVGMAFIFNGQAYATTAFFDDPGSDLRIWQVSGTLPIYAPLYTKTTEVGKQAVILGRGLQRGEPVVVGGQLKGWKWGAGDSLQRWGVNIVSGTANVGAGDALQLKFDASGGPNEGTFSYGDSGGAVFIQDGTDWKLAGIHYATDGPFNTSPIGDGFQASIFDMGGLYVPLTAGTWQLVPDRSTDQPASMYSTRISPRVAWINSILSQPYVPPSPSVGLQSSDTVGGPYVAESSAVVDAAARTISIPVPASRRYYRVAGSDASRISSIRISSGRLVISY